MSDFVKQDCETQRKNVREVYRIGIQKCSLLQVTSKRLKEEIKVNPNLVLQVLIAILISLHWTSWCSVVRLSRLFSAVPLFVQLYWLLSD